jgi:hypothetical protein
MAHLRCQDRLMRLIPLRAMLLLIKTLLLKLLIAATAGGLVYALS